jgi:hypothetical protein
VNPDTRTHEFARGNHAGRSGDRTELHIQDTAGLTGYAIAAGVIESTIHLAIESRPRAPRAG